jgi:MFS family permease
VLGYSPLQTGVALVPITLVVVAVAAVIPKALPRVGVRTALIIAGLLLAGGMALQARLPVDGSYAADVLPAILLTAAGLGSGFVSSTIAATSGVPERQQGLASGLLNTSQQVGGAVGLAVLATLAASRTEDLLRGGDAPVAALTGGFSFGFAGAAALGVLAAAAALAAPGRGTAPPLPGTSSDAAGTPSQATTNPPGSPARAQPSAPRRSSS